MPVIKAAAAELLDEGVAEAADNDESELLLLYTVTVCVTVDVEAAETPNVALFVVLSGIKTSVALCVFTQNSNSARRNCRPPSLVRLGLS